MVSIFMGVKFFKSPVIGVVSLGAESAINFDISNACAGMITGAYILDNLIKSGIVKNGMIVSGEYISCVLETVIKDVQTIDDPQFASLTVGDSGAAFIMDMSSSNGEGIDFIDFVTIAEYADLCIGMTNKSGAGVCMKANIPELHKVGSGYNFFKYIRDAVERNGRKLNNKDYDYILFHQISVSNIIGHMDYAQNQLNINLPDTLICANEYGNTATTTHTLALYNAIKMNKVKKGSKILIIANASGLTLGVLSFTIGDVRVSK